MKPNFADEKFVEQDPNFLSKLKIWIHSSLPPTDQQRTTLPKIRWHQLLIELLIIIITITWYCWPILDFQSNVILPGNEAETFQALDKLLEISLRDFAEFPLWNPFFEYGYPYLADPMTHVFNPFFTIPILIFGTTTGFRLGIYFHFLIAGLGMWWLARNHKANAILRVWMALVFALAGPPVARFYQGQYLFIAGYALFPWVMGGIIGAYQFNKKRYIAVSILAISCMYFSGNIYYPYYMIYVLALFALIHLFIWHRDGFYLNPRIVKIYFQILLLTIGLTAIQLFPMMEFHTWIHKYMLEEQQAHGFYQIWLDLTSKTVPRMDASPILPPEEYYAYIGFLPIFALIALVFVWQKQDKKTMAFFLILSLSLLLCIHFDAMPWKDFLLKNPFFSQFRYPTRLLSLLVFCILFIAGISVDSYMSFLLRIRMSHEKGSLRYKSTGFSIAMVIIILSVSAYDIFSTNKDRIVMYQYNPHEDEVVSNLQISDQGVYTFGTYDNRWYLSLLEHHIPHYKMWYHYQDILRYDTTITERRIFPIANYSILNINKPVPDNSTVIQEFQYTIVYQMHESFPFAFQIPINNLIHTSRSTPVSNDEVIAINDVHISTHQIVIKAKSEKDVMLILIQMHYPGWKLKVDGKPVKIENTSGFLSAPMEEGIHEYVFTYRPTGFIFYIVLSIISLIIVLGMLFEINLGKILKVSGNSRFTSTI